MKTKKLSFILLFGFLFLSHVTQAKTRDNVYKNSPVFFDFRDDTVTESKVDYIEKIYFSGQNKEGLNNMILEMLQDFEGKTTTAAVAVQYSFLNNIKDNAANAKNACDVEELLAAGIYGIDIREALNQKIPKPDNATASQVGPALNAATSISNSVGDVAWTKWYLSGGSAAGAAKAGMTAYKVSSASYMASRTADAVSQTKSLIKGLNFSKDKPCKNVLQKDIQIGNHTMPANSGNDKGIQYGDDDKRNRSRAEAIVVSFSNISYNQSKSIKSSVARIGRVYNVKNDNFSGNAMSITVVTDLKTSMLLDSIIKANPEESFDVTYKSGDDDAQKQIQLSNNKDASKTPSEKKLRTVNIQVAGITYNQSKLLAAQMEKKTGINSAKTSAFYGGMVTITLSTFLTSDELIDAVQKIFPKTNFEVGAATEEMIILSHTDDK